MPLRHEPASLRKAAMAVICEHFEWLCYGASPQEVAAMIDDDRYLNVKGPFQDMREYQGATHCAGWTTHHIPRTLSSKEYVPYSLKFQNIWTIWQLSHYGRIRGTGVGSDFGSIVEYIPSIPEVFECISCRNTFIVQYFR